MKNSSLFHADGVDIFQIIENAILVAAFDHTDELKRQRDTIVELCFKALLPPFPQGAKTDEIIKKDTEEIIKKEKEEEEDRFIDVVEEVTQIKDILSSHHHQSPEERSVEEKIEMRRQETKQLPVSTQELHHVGRDRAIPVNVPSEEIKPRGVAEPEPSRLPKLTSRRQLPLQRRPPSIPQRQSKRDEEASIQANLEVAKRKLHEGYQRADNAKKQRTIKVVEQRDMPKKGRRSLRPIQKLKNEIREWARAHSVKPPQKQ